MWSHFNFSDNELFTWIHSYFRLGKNAESHCVALSRYVPIRHLHIDRIQRICIDLCSSGIFKCVHSEYGICLNPPISDAFICLNLVQCIPLLHTIDKQATYILLSCFILFCIAVYVCLIVCFFLSLSHSQCSRLSAA